MERYERRDLPEVTEAMPEAVNSSKSTLDKGSGCTENGKQELINKMACFKQVYGVSESRLAYTEGVSRDL